MEKTNSAQDYLKRFMSDETITIAKAVNPGFSYIKWFSFGNGLIRPGCASFRDNVAAGEILTTGFKELDDFLAITLGRITMQEDIMKFLVKFCGYSDAESDSVRRLIAKKYGTESAIDEIHDRFISYSHETYGQPKDKLEEIFPPIKQGILDATRYAFSWNHSDAYSCIGYICGYLRYYHPVEFLTAALNTFQDKEEKTLAITEYAKNIGVPILPIKFRHSTDVYTCDSNKIYKGIASIKYMNTTVATEIYSLRSIEYDSFIDLLVDLGKTSINSKQLEILIRLNFFEEFGEENALSKQYHIFDKLNGRKQLKTADLDKLKVPEYIIERNAKTRTEKMYKDFDSVALIKDIVVNTTFKPTTALDKIRAERELLGYVQTVDPSFKPERCLVVDVDGAYSKIITLYQIATGISRKIKCRKKVYLSNVIEPGDIIDIFDVSIERKWGKTSDGEWYQKDETEKLLVNYKRYTD